MVCSMKTKYIILIAVIVLIVAMGITFFLMADDSTTNSSTSDNLQWNTDLNSALQEAQNNNKSVFVDVYASWCTYCKAMDQNTYTDSRVQQKLSNYVLVKINGDQNPDLMEKYQIYSYPTILILDSNGNVVKTISGYQSPDDLINQI